MTSDHFTRARASSSSPPPGGLRSHRAVNAPMSRGAFVHGDAVISRRPHLGSFAIRGTDEQRARSTTAPSGLLFIFRTPARASQGSEASHVQNGRLRAESLTPASQSLPGFCRAPVHWHQELFFLLLGDRDSQGQPRPRGAWRPAGGKGIRPPRWPAAARRTTAPRTRRSARARPTPAPRRRFSARRRRRPPRPWRAAAPRRRPSAAAAAA